jgi:large subunit ribosomal protein L22
MEAIAKTKYLKGSPRKTRLVIDLIRGRNVSQALAILKFTDKRAAQPIAQCLNSAIANATYLAEQQNIAIDPDGLWVKTCFVDMGPTKGRRRMRPAPQGRAFREQRHYCHITIQVTSDEKEKDEKALKAEAAKARRDAAKKAEGGEKKAKPAAKKATAPKAAKKEKTEAAEKPAASPVEEVIETAESKMDAEVSAAKDTTTHTAAEENATKPADEKQQDTNEELERQ